VNLVVGFSRLWIGASDRWLLNEQAHCIHRTAAACKPISVCLLLAMQKFYKRSNGHKLLGCSNLLDCSASGMWRSAQTFCGRYGDKPTLLLVSSFSDVATDLCRICINGVQSNWNLPRWSSSAAASFLLHVRPAQPSVSIVVFVNRAKMCFFVLRLCRDSSLDSVLGIIILCHV